MVFRVRSSGDRRRHGLGGCARVQPNPIQHATRHSPEFGADHIRVRHEANPGPRHGALPHHSEHQGFGGARCGGRISAAESRRKDHRGGHANGGSLAAAERPGCGDSGASQPYPPRFGGGQMRDRKVPHSTSSF